LNIFITCNNSNVSIAFVTVSNFGTSLFKDIPILLQLCANSIDHGFSAALVMYALYLYFNSSCKYILRFERLSIIPYKTPFKLKQLAMVAINDFRSLSSVDERNDCSIISNCLSHISNECSKSLII